MKDLNKDRKGCVPNKSSCIDWKGGNIPCLGIKNGDCLDVVVTLIAEEVCRIAEPTDLSTLTIQCVLDNLDREEPSQRTLFNILQLLFDSNCHLYQLVANLQSQISAGGTPLVLDLKCLAQVDSFGNPLPYTEQTVLQGIINELCTQKATIAAISGQLSNLQNQVDNIDTDPYIEPLISSCFFTGRPTSQAVQLTAQELCNYRGVVGTVPQIQTFIGLRDTGFNAYYQTTPGWVVNPTSAAQELANMQIVLSDLFARIAANEECCRTTCEDIKVGFEIEVNQDGDRITLYYTNVMGTNIPAGWQDIGSTLEITDEQNRQRTFSVLNVSQGGNSDELDISGLTGILNFCLTVKLQNTETNEICTKCECRTFEVTDTACPVCRVDNIGTTGTITIVYQEI